MKLILGLFLIAISLFTFVIVLSGLSQPATQITESSRSAVQSQSSARQSIQVQSPTEQFHGELEKVLYSIPTTDTRKRSGNPELDAHRSPIELAEVAPLLASIRERSESRPELVTESMWFFDQCARKENVLAAVGSVCLKHLRTMARKTNTRIDLSKYPNHLVRLSQQLSFAE